MLSKSSAYPASHTCLYPQDEVVKGQIQPIIPEPKICTKDEAVKCKCSYRHSMVVVQGTLVTMYTEHGLRASYLVHSLKHYNHVAERRTLNALPYYSSAT